MPSNRTQAVAPPRISRHHGRQLRALRHGLQLPDLRVADIQARDGQWSAKGAEFATPPIDRGAEIRCYRRDPDGNQIEVGQATGLLEGRLAKKRPEDLPG
jgi:hypothetical protein